MLVETKRLSRQKIFRRDKQFLSRQNFGDDKHTVVATKDVFCPTNDTKRPLICDVLDTVATHASRI